VPHTGHKFARKKKRETSEKENFFLFAYFAGHPRFTIHDSRNGDWIIRREVAVLGVLFDKHGADKDAFRVAVDKRLCRRPRSRGT
jgi:hypothetical protein